MGKNLIIGALLVIAGALAYIHYWPMTKPADEATVPAQEETVVCAQVITPARDPQTGTIKEYPTPCDVPDGWEVIQNDVPSLDLEVQ